MTTDSNQQKVLLQAVRKCRGNLIAALLFSFFINLLVFVGPLYMLQIYDRVLSSRSEVTLVVLTMLAVGLLFIYALLEIVRSRILVRTGVYFDELLSSKVFQTAFRGQVLRPGQNYDQSLRDLDNLREFMTGAGIIAFFDAPWVPVFIAACFLLHFWLGIVALIGAVLIFALAVANEVSTRPLLSEASRAAIAANDYVTSSLRNAETVHALGMSGAMLQRWTKSHLELLSGQAKASDRAAMIMGPFKAIRMALQVAILGVGAYLVIDGQQTAGAMIAASILMGRALAPVEAAVGHWKQFVGARSAWARLQSVMRTTPPEIDRMALPAPKGAIQLESVTVVPPGARTPSLRGVSFSIEPGEAVAIVGPSGAGKSSLVRAIVGVWPALQGSVRLDGADISHWNPEALGAHLGYLPQEVELFAGTVAENISRFSELDEHKVIAAAKIAGAHDVIQRMPDGYETPVGDGGRSLSGGQRQRVALARALYDEPAIIVLDEPNSNLDTEGEKALSDAIRWARSNGRTVVIVTHRTALLSHVDKVAVVIDGILKRYGPPDQVLDAQISNVSPLRPPAVPASA